jgi:hypothetical protein
LSFGIGSGVPSTAAGKEAGGGISRDVLLPVGTNRYKNAVGLKSRVGPFFLGAQRGLITASTNEKRSAASTMALAKQQLSKCGYSRPTHSQVSVQ